MFPATRTGAFFRRPFINNSGEMFSAITRLREITAYHNNFALSLIKDRSRIGPARCFPKKEKADPMLIDALSNSARSDFRLLTLPSSLRRMCSRAISDLKKTLSLKARSGLRRKVLIASTDTSNTRLSHLACAR